jgi:triosephosphate isomerase
MRKPFVAGNWKMFTTAASARQLAQDIVRGLGQEERVTVGVFPPFPYLSHLADVVRGSPIVLGGQNAYCELEGPFTGEVSPRMLLDVGCEYVILGHSERRHKVGETIEFISRKVRTALAAGLRVILCVGETLVERQANQTETVLANQLTGSLAGVTLLARLVLAYEPVWAIGTGQNATPDQAQQAHTFIRRLMADRFGAEAAAALVIQYGGSVKPENVASLLHQPDVDGALVGGASLQAESFLAIVRAAL